MQKKYEVEMKRTGTSPKQFYSYCRRQMAKKGLDIESWTSFEDWAKPITERDDKIPHTDWEKPKLEIIRYLPLKLHLYFEGSYNFIFEFEYWDEKTGDGYLYAVEYEGQGYG